MLCWHSTGIGQKALIDIKRYLRANGMIEYSAKLPPNVIPKRADADNVSALLFLKTNYN